MIVIFTVSLTTSGSGGHDTEVLHCKREVEEEEAMVLAQLQSLVEEDQPHPPISLLKLSSYMFNLTI